MPPSNQNINVPSVSQRQKIELEINGRSNIKMIPQLHQDGYNLMALYPNPSEPKFEKLPSVGKGWQEKTSEDLHQMFNIQSRRVGMRLGRQLNGRYLISIDFDVNDKAGNHQQVADKLDEYNANINRQDGMFSSSTSNNFNVLVDITDLPDYMEKVLAYSTKGWKWGGGLEVLVKQTAHQVIPPTATTNKKTEVMGQPRKFLNDVPIYKVQADDAFMIQFLNEIYVPETKKIIIKTSPVRRIQTVEEPDDEWTELLFKVIKNDVKTKENGNQDWTVSYKQWMGIGTILKHNNYSLSTFKRWTMMCPLARDDGRIEDYWESIKGEGFSIYALQGIAKVINPVEYKIWFVKHKKYISLKTLSLGMNDVAQFMKNILAEHCIYTGKSNGWYRNTGSLWFHSDDAPLATITTQLQRIIDLSRETLLAKKNATENEEECKRMEELLTAYTKHYQLCGSASYSTHIAKLLKEYLYDDGFIKRLNQVKYKIVYKNGIYDMKTKKFRQGIYPQEFISKTLPYEYEVGDAEVKKEIRKQLKRICNNNEEQLNYYLSVVGYALTGDSAKEQFLWWMCGESACNGKSSMLVALTDILPIYFKKEGREHIDLKATKTHKAIATWEDYRVVWINEATQEPKNSDLLKDIVDGSPIQFDKMYGNSTSMAITFKLLVVSNYQFKIKFDNGIERRFVHMQYDSKFSLEEGDQEDEVKCIFVKNKAFGTWLEENKHSLLELLYEYSYQYAIKESLPKVPAVWDEIKKDTVASQNTFEATLYAMCVVGEGLECWNDDAIQVLEVDSGVIKNEMKKLKLFHKYESQTKSKGKKGLHKGFRLKTKAELDAEEKAQDEERKANGNPLPSTDYEDPDQEYM